MGLDDSIADLLYQLYCSIRETTDEEYERYPFIKENEILVIYHLHNAMGNRISTDKATKVWHEERLRDDSSYSD